MKYRSIPVTVDAIQFIVYDIAGLENARAYCESLGVMMKGPSTVVGFVSLVGFVSFSLEEDSGCSVGNGDWIIANTKGTRSVMGNTEFISKYEKVVE